MALVRFQNKRWPKLGQSIWLPQICYANFSLGSHVPFFRFRPNGPKWYCSWLCFVFLQAAYDKAKRKEQSSSRSSGGASPRGGFPGGMPGGGFPGGMPGGGFPGGMPGGGFPGGMPGGFPGGAMPGGVPGNVDMSKILNVSDLELATLIGFHSLRWQSLHMYVFPSSTGPWSDGSIWWPWGYGSSSRWYALTLAYLWFTCSSSSPYVVLFLDNINLFY